VPGFRPFIGARANTAGARLQGKRPDQRRSGWDADGPGTPKGEGESVTRNFNHANSDPGALGGTPGVKTHGAKKNNAKKKRLRIVKKIDGEEVILEPANVWALNAWAPLLVGLDELHRYGGGAIEGRSVVQRTDIVRLLLNVQQEELLRHIGDQTARLINMENYRRRQIFYAKRGIDTGVKVARELATKTEYNEMKGILGSRNFDETLRKVAEAWKSFAELLKEKKKGKLPLWLNPKPPGYRKMDGTRIPIIIVRADNYRIDAERKVIHLGYLNISIQFTGKLRWLAKPGAKRGRMEITYDPVKKRWYALISVRITLERRNKGQDSMGIDLGREILATAVTSSGNALLYKGGVLKSDYFYFERRIAEVDKALSDPGMEEADRAVLWEERRRLFEKRKRRRNQIFANLASHLAREAVKRNIGIVFIGHPLGIAQNKAGKGNTNLWSYKKLIDRLATTLENHGIAVFLINEDNTSKKCAWHRVEVERKPRGLVHCSLGHTVHSDVNGALNILKRGLEALGIEAELPRKIRVLSFIPTPCRVVERKNHNPAIKAG
jgi:putative transposase